MSLVEQGNTLIVGFLTHLQRCLVAILFLIAADRAQSQDIHFSQYLSAPFNLNPSLTGDFTGDYRLIANYRNQWKSITVPFTTYGISGDMNKVGGVNNLSAGLSVYSDRAGDSRLNTTIIQASGSYGYPLTLDSAHSIYFGLMPGLVRQQIDYSDLQFDNQYDLQTGLYNSNLSSGELQDRQAVTYFNLSAGLRWNFTLAPRHKIDVGLGVFNLTNAGKFYLSEKTSDLRRYNFHTNYQLKVWKKVDILPSVLYTVQGENENMIFGSSMRYLYSNSTALHGGMWYRNDDAFYLTAGLTYQSLFIGFSYDINTSVLRDASDGQGAYELSIIYVIRKFKPNRGKYLSCPNYL